MGHVFCCGPASLGRSFSSRRVLTHGTRDSHPLRWTSRTMRYLSLLSFALATVLGVRNLSAQTTAPSADQVMLSPGDSVRIVVWRKPEFSGDYVVAPDGTITHPLFRAVQVAGIPFATAEANLRRFLSGFEENPQFVIEPLIRIAISGQVTRPAVFAV